MKPLERSCARRGLWCLLWLSLSTGLLAQWTTPVVDGTADAPAFYPHVFASGATQWRLAWNDTELFVHVQNAPQHDPVVIYLDIDPIVPVNGGTDGDGTLLARTLDGVTNAPVLPFRADIILYARQDYREIFRRDGANGWLSLGGGPDGFCGSGTDDLAGNAQARYAFSDNGNGPGSDDRREFRIAWSRLLGAMNGGLRPTAFHWLGYMGYANGMYAPVPAENYSGGQVSDNPGGLPFYFTVAQTGQQQTTPPFALRSYTWPGIQNTNLPGPMTVFDLTLNHAGYQLSRLPDGGDWTVAGTLVVGAGTLSFGSGGPGFGASSVRNIDLRGGLLSMGQTDKPLVVEGDVRMAGGTLQLSGAAGGDLLLQGSFHKTGGTFLHQGRKVVFQGTAAQHWQSHMPETIGQLTVTNTQGAVTALSHLTVASRLEIGAGARLDMGNMNLTITGITSHIEGILSSAGTIPGATAATLHFAPGSTYEHRHSTAAGAIPLANWQPGSTCAIVGYTTNSGSPSNLAQAFHHFVWDCPGQLANINLSGALTQVTGNLVVRQTGTGTLRLSGSSPAAPVLNLQGSFLMQGGTLETTSGSSAPAIRLGGDFLQSGGTLTETGSGITTFQFIGSGEQRMEQSGGAMLGDFVWQVGDGSSPVTLVLQTPVNLGNRTGLGFQVNALATLDCGPHALHTGATLTGNFHARAGSTIITGHAQGIQAGGSAGGSIQVGSLASSRIFDAGAHLVYRAQVAQVTGTGCLAAASLTINNPQGVTLSQPTTVGQQLLLSQGKLVLGSHSLSVTSAAEEAIRIQQGWVETNSTGMLRRRIGTTPAIYEFPVGNGAFLTPVVYDFTSSDTPFDLEVRAVESTHPAVATTDYLRNRHWISQTQPAAPGAYAYRASFHFVHGDISGSADRVRLSRWNGSAWSYDLAGEATGNVIRSGALDESIGALANAHWSARAMPAPATYTWNGAASAPWTDAAQWTPTGVPGPNDAVIFDKNSAMAVGNVPTGITLSSLQVRAGTVVLQAGTAGTLAIGGTAGQPLQVNAGAQLTLSGTQSLSLLLQPGSTGSILGVMRVQLGGHKLLASDRGSLVFGPGARFEGAHTTGNPFGNAGAAETTLFQAGSTYEHLSAGGNPFGLGQPQSKVVFQTGSLYRQASNAFGSFSGRVYANYEQTLGNFTNIIGGAAFHVDNLILRANTALHLNLTSAEHTIRGNITVEAGASLRFNEDGSAATITLCGLSRQVVSGTGTLSLGAQARLVVANEAGVDLGKSMVCLGRMEVGQNAVLRITGENAVTGTGQFSLTDGATLEIGSAYGITAAAMGSVGGNVQTQQRHFSGQANYTYAGTINQQTGDGLPTLLNGTLTVNNRGAAGSNIVHLSRQPITCARLHLASGIFSPGATAMPNVVMAAGGEVRSTGGALAAGMAAGYFSFSAGGSVNAQVPLTFYEASTGPGGSETRMGWADGAVPATIAYRYTVHAGVTTATAPYYVAGSTLLYHTGGTYARGTEWTGTPGQPGYPHHVVVQQGTRLLLGQNPMASPALEMGGDLQVGAGNLPGVVEMDNRMAQPVVVRGNLLLGGGTAAGSQLVLSEQAGGDLEIHGHYTQTLQGQLLQRQGAVIFRGSGNSTLTAPGTARFSRLVVDKADTAIAILPEVPVEITTSFALRKGRYVSTVANMLTITNGEPDDAQNGVILASRDRNPGYVEGPMMRTVNQASGDYVFPFGTRAGGVNYFRPMTLRPSAKPGCSFRASYMRQAPPDPSTDQFMNNLLGIVNREYWQVERLGTAGTEARLVIPYTPPGMNGWRAPNGSLVNPCANCNVAVVKRTSQADPVNGKYTWDFTAPPNKFSGAGPIPEYQWHQQAGLMLSHPVSDFAQFTIGFAFNVVLALPVVLQRFEVDLQDHNALLHWQVHGEKELLYTEPEHSTDGVHFRPVGRVMAGGGSSCQFVHASLLSGRHYYRLKLVDKDGQAQYSATRVVEVTKPALNFVGLRQNPVRVYLVPVVWSPRAQEVQFSITDLSGRVLRSTKHMLVQGKNEPPLLVTGLPQGQYFLTMAERAGIRQTLRWQKE